MTNNTPKWAEELYALLYEEYGDVGQNHNITSFIETVILPQARAELVETIMNHKFNTFNAKTALMDRNVELSVNPTPTGE